MEIVVGLVQVWTRSVNKPVHPHELDWSEVDKEEEMLQDSDNHPSIHSSMPDIIIINFIDQYNSPVLFLLQLAWCLDNLYDLWRWDWVVERDSDDNQLISGPEERG